MKQNKQEQIKEIIEKCREYVVNWGAVEINNKLRNKI